MEYYDKCGNIKRIQMEFEPVNVRPKPIGGKPPPELYKPVLSAYCCDACKNYDSCVYLRYREYCSDDFLNNRDCEKLDLINERRKNLHALGMNGGGGR